MDIKILFGKLLIGKQLEFDTGKIRLVGQPMIMLPVVTISRMQHYIEKESKYRKVGESVLYYAAKDAGIHYMTEYKNHFGVSNPSKLLDWALNSVHLAGWGIFTPSKFDVKERTAVFKVESSPFALEAGKGKYPVDHIISGYIAGGLTVMFNKDTDCKEIKCISTGYPYCEFVANKSVKK